MDFLDGIRARELTHAVIVPLVQKELEGLDVGELGNHGWWAQGITVGYEQHIGRRLPGQKSDGTFACSASKTVPGTMDDALTAWIALVDGRATFLDRELVSEPTTSATARWRYWRYSAAPNRYQSPSRQSIGSGANLRPWARKTISLHWLTDCPSTVSPT